MSNRGRTGALLGLAVALSIATAAPLLAQIIGGGPGSRLRQLRERRENTSQGGQVHYNAAVLAAGTPRERVLAAFGEPNATQGAGAAREDVYAFRPDGSKWAEPQVSGKTIAAAVFTGGMSLAVRKARTTIQEEQLTLYHVHYDTHDKVASVKAEPPKIGSGKSGPPSPAAQ